MVVQISKAYLLAEYQLEPDKRILFRNGEAIHLAHRPFQVLLYLLENRDRVVTRQELFEQFWDGKDVYDDALRKCVGAIRKALDDSSEQPRFIETRYREGYRYIGPVEEQMTSTLPPVVEVERTRSVKIRFEEELQDATAAQAATAVAAAVKTLPPTRTKLARRTIAIGAIVMLALTGALTWVIAHSINKPTRNVATNSAMPIRSIAVLPLKNLTGDSGQDYFSDGVTESFITELSKIDGLKVISRNSVFTFKDKEVDPREAGRRLDVAAVLEGSVRKNNDTVRVDVRLVDTRNGSIIWSGTSFNRGLNDILAVQDEIACSVVAGLRLKLCQEGQPIARRNTDNIEAYQAYLKGRYYWNKRTADGIKRAIDYFTLATQLDPNYALAYAMLANSYKLGVWYIPLPATEAVPKLRAAAMRAIELDDQLAEAHVAMGEVASFEGHYLDAITEQERAISLNPGDADLHHNYSLGIGLLGRLDKAIDDSKRAIELDPLSLIINTDAGWVYYLARRYDEAINQYQKTLELDPNYTLAHFDLALALSQKGMHEEAIAEMLKAQNRGSDYLAGLGYVYARAGKRDKAAKVLDDLKSLSRKQYVPTYHLAWIYTGLGDNDAAIALLEKVYAEHTQQVVDFKMHPMFDSLRSDPRFQDLVRRVGLPD